MVQQGLVAHLQTGSFLLLESICPSEPLLLVYFSCLFLLLLLYRQDRDTESVAVCFPTSLPILSTPTSHPSTFTTTLSAPSAFQVSRPPSIHPSTLLPPSSQSPPLCLSPPLICFPSQSALLPRVNPHCLLPSPISPISPFSPLSLATHPSTLTFVSSRSTTSCRMRMLIKPGPTMLRDATKSFGGVAATMAAATFCGGAPPPTFLHSGSAELHW